MPITSDTPAARSLALRRAAAEALRGQEWGIGEGVVFSAGTLDVSAERRYRRSPLGARVRLAVFCDDGEPRELTIAETDAPDSSLASYALGDDDRAQRDAIGRELAPYVDPAAAVTALHAAAYPHEHSLVEPCRVPAPPARVSASGITGLDTTAAFGAIDAIRADLLAFDLEVIVDDLSLLEDAGERDEHARASLAFRATSCDLIHVVVLTGAALGVPSVRLVQSSLTGATRWIDVVQSDAVEEWAERVTSHYDAQFRRRDFERA